MVYLAVVLVSNVSSWSTVFHMCHISKQDRQIGVFHHILDMVGVLLAYQIL